MHANRPALLIRADATPAKGMGHVMRMLALAQAWMDRGGRVELLGHIEVHGLKQRLRDEGLLVRGLDSIHPHPGDLSALLQAVEETRPGWLALDGYHFGPDYQATASHRGAKVLAVDDMAHHPAYSANLILNQNLGAEALAYSAPGARMLLGPRFALLRREFRLADQPERQPRPARRILVSAGGSDPAGLTPLLLEALDLSDLAGMEARVVCGPANPMRGQLEQRLRELSYPASLITPGADLPTHMAWAELALTAAGSTCWELARMGVPMIAFALADNQLGVLQGLSKAGLAVSGGAVDGISPADIVGRIRALADDPKALAGLSSAGRAAVDGQGAMRVAEAMETLR